MKKLMVMFAMLAWVATALAQPGPGGPGGRRGMGPGMGFGFGMGGGFGLLMMPEVQKELNITEQQMQQIGQLMAQQREQMQALMQQMRDATPEQRQQLMQQAMQKWDEGIGKILQPAQKTRLRELQLQAEGASALARPDVAKELNLSEDQRKKIGDITTQYRQKQMQLWQQGRGPGVDRQAMFQQMQQLRQQMDKELLAVLTTQQLEQWKKMQGKPFQFPRGPGMRPGGPGGPAGGGPREL
jgi:Spy/CpxP family protein refolding chaperone